MSFISLPKRMYPFYIYQSALHQQQPIPPFLNIPFAPTEQIFQAKLTSLKFCNWILSSANHFSPSFLFTSLTSGNPIFWVAVTQPLSLFKQYSFNGKIKHKIARDHGLEQKTKFKWTPSRKTSLELHRVRGTQMWRVICPRRTNRLPHWHSSPHSNKVLETKQQFKTIS